MPTCACPPASTGLTRLQHARPARPSNDPGSVARKRLAMSIRPQRSGASPPCMGVHAAIWVDSATIRWPFSDHGWSWDVCAVDLGADPSSPQPLLRVAPTKSSPDERIGVVTVLDVSPTLNEPVALIWVGQGAWFELWTKAAWASSETHVHQSNAIACDGESL